MTSLKAWLFKKVLRAIMPHDLDYEKMRRKLDKLGQYYKLPADVAIEPVRIGGVEAEWASTAEAKKDNVIIFLHGGSYCIGSITAYRAFTCGLAKESGIPTLSVGYRLAPENPFPAALDDALSVYRRLIENGMDNRNIVLLGDSAGGGLCLSTVMALRDNNDPLPAAVVLLSPWADLTMSSGSCLGMAKKNPANSYEFDQSCAKVYAKNTILKNPFVSPVFGNFRSFPPVLIHGGTEDMYADDASEISRKAVLDGIDVTKKIWKGMFHDFTIFYSNTPEGMESFKEVIKWVKIHI